MNQHDKTMQHSDEFYEQVYKINCRMTREVYDRLSEQRRKTPLYVYSHGFGEPGGHGEGPTYPDAPLAFSKAVFYTKPTVHALANFLKEMVDSDWLRIYLHGTSVGAGVVINCLHALKNYKNDPTYL
jgi:hypothetical protein